MIRKQLKEIMDRFTFAPCSLLRAEPSLWWTAIVVVLFKPNQRCYINVSIYPSTASSPLHSAQRHAMLTVWPWSSSSRVSIKWVSNFSVFIIRTHNVAFSTNKQPTSLCPSIAASFVTPDIPVTTNQTCKTILDYWLPGVAPFGLSLSRT